MKTFNKIWSVILAFLFILGAYQHSWLKVIVCGLGALIIGWQGYFDKESL